MIFTFTYDDEYIPSRFDFAKERFRGLFTTEEVENVKTFLRILLILFMLGSVFVLQVPASHFVFPFFSLHTHFISLTFSIKDYRVQDLVKASGSY